MAHRIWPLGLLLTLLALVALDLPARPAAAKTMYSYDFEGDLGPWTAGWDSGLGLNRTDSFCPVDDGRGMALVATPEFRQARSTDQAPAPPQRIVAYMGAAFAVGPFDNIAVDWMTKPEAGCGPGADCLPVIAVSQSADPANLVWHGVKGGANFDGWTSDHYATTLPTTLQASNSTTGKVYIALGVARYGPDYGFMSLGIDCVQIRIAPSMP